MNAEIISVGTELLLGDILNTNAQFLAQQLAELGFGVFHQEVVGDNPDRLRETVERAKANNHVVLLTGGLGPTDDDLTKQTVAQVYGDELVMDEEELASLTRYFEQRGYPMTPNNAKQAMTPKQGSKLPNSNGTAPGAYFEQDGKCAFLMPGPPREMKPMFLQQVRPVLEGMQDATIRSRVLRVFGIGESSLEDLIHPMLQCQNPTTALYAKTGEVHIRITARAATAQQALQLCDTRVAELKNELGDMVYAENGENLQTTLVKLLQKNNQTVATAESCTGGLLSGRITSVPGASAVFGFGLCSYANEVKQNMLGVKAQTLDEFGAVSSNTAVEMAFGAQKLGNATFGVGITGIAGPDGGTQEKPVGLVYVAVSTQDLAWVKQLHLGGREREVVRILATHHALDMVRRLSLHKEIPDAKLFGRDSVATWK